MRVALFVTCLVDTVYPEAGQAAVRVLERLGHQVVFPAAQTCCGQMHANSGYLRPALALARRYVDVFGNCERRRSVPAPTSCRSSSSTCSGSMRWGRTTRTG
jgi:L-lactate dehydrogenase complex protein LldE